MSGTARLHTGHSILMSIHRFRQSWWNTWSHGVTTRGLESLLPPTGIMQIAQSWYIYIYNIHIHTYIKYDEDHIVYIYYADHILYVYYIYIYTLLSPTDITQVALTARKDIHMEWQYEETYAARSAQKKKSWSTHTPTSFSEISTIGMRR